MKETLRILFSEQLFFFKLFISFLVLGAVLLLFTQKGDTVIFINRYANTIIDSFFIHYTELGNALVAVSIAILLLLYRFFHGIAAGISLSLSGLMSMLFKQVLFSDFNRPTLMIDHSRFSHFIDNFNYHSNNSFPSGHTMTAFSIFVTIAFLFNNKKITLLMFLLSLGVAFSRMYLLQHFFVDVYFGAIIGVFNAVVALLICKTSMNTDKFILRGLLMRQSV